MKVFVITNAKTTICPNQFSYRKNERIFSVFFSIIYVNDDDDDYHNDVDDDDDYEIRDDDDDDDDENGFAFIGEIV